VPAAAPNPAGAARAVPTAAGPASPSATGDQEAHQEAQVEAAHRHQGGLTGQPPQPPAEVGGHPSCPTGLKRRLSECSRSILIIVWHLLADPNLRYHDLGAGFYDTRINAERAKRNHVHQLKALGYKVTVQPAA
jgi:hypothetical protein